MVDVYKIDHIPKHNQVNHCKVSAVLLVWGQSGYNCCKCMGNCFDFEPMK